ncbi:MAG: tetratricopeptide repeat protein [Bacteroidales bacterium]|nr:tetratricopeptide repeat protein [Bacteroidales bacterium]
METNDISKIYHSTIKEIERLALKPAFDKIWTLLEKNENWDFQQSLENIERNYRYLLTYLIDGVEDKERNKIYYSTVVSSFQLADDIYLSIQTKSDSRIYYEKRRIYQRSMPAGINAAMEKLLSAQNGTESEQLANDLFNACWLSNRLQTDERNGISSFLHNPKSKIYHQQLLISALLLGCFCHFDETKIRLLIETCYSQEQAIRQRALVCTLLLLHRYENRIQYYDILTREIEALCSEPWFVANARTITMQFILSQQTEEINNHFNKKFMEHINDIAPIIKNKLQNDTLTEEDLYNEKNPEWQKSLYSDEMTKLMQEVMDLQSEGADLFVSTFSRLKNYPFFYTLSNWFLPYYSENSAVGGQSKETEEILNMTPLICDSDKYSLMIAVNQLNNNFFTMVRNQIVQSTEMLKEQQEMNFDFDPARKSAILSTLYIHDLYRFFKLHPRHLDFYDPFSYILNFYSIKPLQKYLGDVESLGIFSEYYLKKDLYKEAIPLFETLTRIAPSQSEYFQKLGFCHQLLQQTEAALDAYLKAELIQSDHIWTLKKIALCYRQLKQPEKALTYYKRLEALQPENRNIQLNLGHLLLETGKTEEALKYYFQVEFNDKKEGYKAWRPIAWCSFISGKPEQAERYYELILANKPTASDWLNAGHVQIAQGNTRKAVDLYLNSITESSLEEFQKHYSEDLPILLKLNLEELLLNAVSDEIMYILKERKK